MITRVGMGVDTRRPAPCILTAGGAASQAGHAAPPRLHPPAALVETPRWGVSRWHNSKRNPTPISVGGSYFILILATLACNTLLPPRPPIEWNTAPDAVIAEAHTGGGMLYEPNLTYHARLWGDGRLIWTEYDGQGGRAVFTTTFAPADMTLLLQDFVDAGFFGWDNTYSPGLVYDAPSTCLRVSLTSLSHSVCEVLAGAPNQFRPLYAHLTSGGGSFAARYVPSRAYLSLTPAGPPDSAAPTTRAVAWPASLTPTLAEVASQGGAWIDGAALAFAWDAVNAQPLQPIFQQAEVYYSVQLLVEGLTVISPP